MLTLNVPKPWKLEDRKLILNTWRGFSRVNVWLTVSDSSSIFHQILPTTFNSIHLLGVPASKSVLLLHNIAPYVDGEVLSTIQIHLATPAVHLRTLRWVPYLEPVPFMDFVFFLTLWMPDSVQKAMWIIVLMFFPFNSNGVIIEYWLSHLKASM